MTTSRITRPALLAVFLIALLVPAGASAGTVSMDVDQSARSRPRLLDEGADAERRAGSGRGPGRPAPAGEPAPPAESGPPAYVPPAAPATATPACSAARRLARGPRRSSRHRSSTRRPRESGRTARCSSPSRAAPIPVTSSARERPSTAATAASSGPPDTASTTPSCGGGKSVNFSFVPAYANGSAPYGRWPAKQLVTAKQWKRFANFRFDLGAAVVRRLNGKTLQATIGARGIGFDQPRPKHFDDLRLPGEAAVHRRLEYRCASSNKGTDSPGGKGPATMRSSCNMTPGSSGGGWIAAGTLILGHELQLRIGARVTSTGRTSRGPPSGSTSGVRR